MHVNIKLIGIFLFILVATVVAEDTNISSLKKLNNEELIQLFLEGKGFSEMTEKIKENNAEQNKEIEKLLLERWKKSNDASLVKARCLQGLRLVKSQEAVDFLIIKLLEGNTRKERISAARDLGVLRNTSAVPALESAVSADKGVFGEGRSIARRSIFALGEIGEPAVPSLMKIWEDKNLRVGCEEGLISAMGYTKDKRFIPILLKTLERKDGLGRDNAARVLGEIGNDTVLPELRKYQNDTNKEVRDNVLEAISKIEQRTKKKENKNISPCFTNALVP